MFTIVVCVVTAKSHLLISTAEADQLNVIHFAGHKHKHKPKHWTKRNVEPMMALGSPRVHPLGTMTVCTSSAGGATGIARGSPKSGIHPLGSMNVGTQFHSKLSSSC